MTKKIVSILLVLAFAVSLFAGSALAVAGDSSGNLSDFTVVSYASVSSHSYIFSTVTASTSSLCTSRSVYVLPAPLSSGQFLNGISLYPSGTSSGFLDIFVSLRSFNLAFYDVFGNQLSSTGNTPSFPISVPAGTSLIRFVAFTTVSSSATIRLSVSFTGLDYDNFIYEDMPFSSEILSGLTAIAKSLLDLETGPYTTTSGLSLNSDGIVTPTTRNDATLETLLNLIGVSSTYSSLAIEQMNLNFGNYFEYHEIEDTSSGTVTVVKNLPAYVNALGMELTDGINKLQRDNLMIYQQGENIEDALFTDKTENQPWSVAQWLKDIYTAITSFFSSFWSPAETDLKTAAEDGMQAAADNGNAASGSQVDDVNSAADAFKEFGSTGNIGSGDVMDIFSDGASYDFFSQTTKDNLAYHPPAGSQRMLRSSSSPVESDQSEEEYVDELDDKLSYWREVLGLP